MRRELQLPPNDVAALEARGLPWETAAAGGANWLFVQDWPTPGYTPDRARMGVRLAAYPSGLLDMVYFSPPLARGDGKPVVGLSLTSVDGATFQQWSRHYEWRTGVDSLTRHLRRVDAWLRREFEKR